MFSFSEKQELVNYIKKCVSEVKDYKDIVNLNIEIDTLMILHCLKSEEDRDYFKSLFNMVLKSKGFNYDLDTVKKYFSKDKYIENCRSSSYSYHDPYWDNDKKCWFVRDYENAGFHQEVFKKI